MGSCQKWVARIDGCRWPLMWWQRLMLNEVVFAISGTGRVALLEAEESCETLVFLNFGFTKKTTTCSFKVEQVV